MIKITHSDFKYFTNRVNYWSRFYCLQDINITTIQEPLEGSTLAECRFSYPDRNCQIALEVGVFHIEDGSMVKMLDKLAHHEVCEAMLSPVRQSILPYKKTIWSEMDNNIHYIIHKLWAIQLRKKPKKAFRLP